MKILVCLLSASLLGDGASLLSSVTVQNPHLMRIPPPNSHFYRPGRAFVRHINLHNERACVRMAGSSHFIDWPETTTLTYDHQNALSEVLLRRGEFCDVNALPAYRMKAIQDRVSVVSEWRGLPEDLVFGQAKSLRSQMLAEKASFSSRRLQNNQLPLCYERGASVKQISRDFDVPPVAVIRAVLQHRCSISFPRMQRQIQRSNVKETLRGVQVEGLELSPRDCEELAWAKDRDSCTWEDSGYRTEREEMAAAFESLLYEYLDAKDIPFRSEQDIRAEHELECGAMGDVPVGQLPSMPPTPDVVLLESEVQLTINGQRIYWIDAKNYFGAAAGPRDKRKLFLKKTRKQADKYNDKWGRGAVVYKMGFCNRLQSQIGASALVLDSSIILTKPS